VTNVTWYLDQKKDGKFTARHMKTRNQRCKRANMGDFDKPDFSQ